MAKGTYYLSMKRMLLVPVCGLFLGMLSGCTILVPDEIESSPASTAARPTMQELPAGCPSADGFPVPGRLGIGTDDENAEMLLARLSDWANAGTDMVASDPDWSAEAGTGGCLEALAAAIGQVYGQVLYFREGDGSLAELGKAMVSENLGNLRRASALGQVSKAEFYLLDHAVSSSSEDGQYLKIRVGVQPGDSMQPRRGEDWDVLLKTQDAGLAVVRASGFSSAGVT